MLGRTKDKTTGESGNIQQDGQMRTTLSSRVQDELNAQIKHELASAYAYLAMAAYCDEHNLPGMAHWLRVQSREEVEHAMQFYDFILDRDGHVALRAIDQPPSDFASPLEVFRQALDNERQVSRMIHDLYALAGEERDYASQAMLQGFVSEQVEEEKITSEVVAMLEMVGDRGEGLFLVDRELARREDDGDD